MRKALFALVAAVAALGPARAQPADPFDAYAARTAAAVAAVWPKMGEIWPGADFARLILLLTDGSRLWAISAAGLEQLDWSEAPGVALPPPGGFARASWRGGPAVVVRVLGQGGVEGAEADPAVPGAFAYATHEAFHFYGQAGWQRSFVGASRATAYPVEAGPRLLRYATFLALQGAYDEPARRAEHVAAAAHWHGRWRREHPAEAAAIASTDLSEGTAYYVEVVATARAALGTEAGPGALRARLADALRQAALAGRFSGADRESYPLGLAAGLVADELGLDWKAAAARGVPPLEALLADVAPVERPAPAVALAEVEAAVAARNRSVAPALEPFLERYRAGATLLAVPREALAGSFGTSGFFSSAAVPYGLVASVTASYRLAGGALSVERVTAGSTDAAVPGCPGRGHFVFAVLPGEVRLEGPQVVVNAPGLTGSFEVTPIQLEDGRPVLCARGG